jgi:hypothetical protein
MLFLVDHEGWVQTLANHLYSHSVANLLQAFLIFDQMADDAKTYMLERVEVI